MNSVPAEPRAMQTRDAARYLGISASLLRKMRGRGPDDPLMRGPNYRKLGPNLVLYDRVELDRWIESYAAKHPGSAAS